YIREQTSQILTHGPSTPAKIPNSKILRNSSNYRNQRTGSEKKFYSSSCRGKLFFDIVPPSLQSPNASISASELHGSSIVNGSSELNSSSDLLNVDLSTSSSVGSSPVFSRSERRSAQKTNLGSFLVAAPIRRSRRKGSNCTSGSSRPVGHDVGRNTNDEVKSESSSFSSLKQKKQSEMNLVSNCSPSDQLNLHDLEEFPPMSVAGKINKTKPSRRINPTPVSTERTLSKPKICFTSTPVGNSQVLSGASSENVTDSLEKNLTSITGSLQEEREMLKKERSKLLHHTSSSLSLSLDSGMSTKSNVGCNVYLQTENQSVASADVNKVTYRKQLEHLAELYSICIAVPSSAFFPILFTDLIERQHFHSIHNCVYFAVQVLDYQFEIVSHLEKGTLKLLAENDRIASFSLGLHERLMAAYENTTAKVSLWLPSCVQSVSFQPETDNRSNFSSDKAFHIFKKQRDIFYELLREWEDNFEKTGWDFEKCLGDRIRVMMAHLSAACNYSHFARLFQKQLLQMCKGSVGGGTSWGDTPDQDVLNMLGPDSLNRLKRLQERFLVPQSIRGPCPPPSFPGCQEFFRDFILSAGSYRFNQHLVDSLCLQILELDSFALVEHEPSEGEAMSEQDEKKHFASVLMSLRLLAKFVGFLVFLPYRTSEPATGDLLESAITLRNHTHPVLDIFKLLRQSIQKRCMVLTVPWVVEFLSLMDYIAPFLNYYEKIFALLLQLYRYLLLSEDKKMCFLNKLLILAVLGWLFQVPTVPENLFFAGEVRLDALSLESVTTSQALDSVPLVDQQLLYSCCPYLGELRKLLSSFVLGSGGKNGGYIRKITPTATEALAPKPSFTQQKLQADLQQAFFHNQSPSLRRTVEFVAERIGSNCVKHIKATLVAELVKRAEVILQDAMKAEDGNHDKLLDAVCSQLYQEGAQALIQGKEFCKKKAPEAVKILLPEETSAAVLNCAANIAVGLAIEKACSWLSTNIAALIKREVKATFSRMLKVQMLSQSSANEVILKKDCSPNCHHQTAFPSQIISEIKDLLCIAIGPREENEEVRFADLESLLGRVSQTLQPMFPFFLLIVSDRVPIQELNFPSPKMPEQQQSKYHFISSLLKSLLSIWKDNFQAPVPLHLMFSQKNITYLTFDSKECDFFHLFSVKFILLPEYSWGISKPLPKRIVELIWNLSSKSIIKNANIHI
uniref:Codanin-1 C-terminal domain-containing protein n=1 Tax=Naja naja TaxID=35670 RepID=A0A8C7E5Y9_NAJNA